MSIEPQHKVLVLPIRVDALCIQHPANAVGPTADYTNLPHVDGRTGHDINPNTPFVATEAFSRPFDVTGMLEPGVHVHWTLPDCLRRAQHPLDQHGIEQRDRVDFPRVCNRWLVRRCIADQPDKTRHWLVQSDYIWPEHARAPAGSISVLLPDNRWKDGMPPARHMGIQRVLEVSKEWNPSLPELATALAGACRSGDSWEQLSGHPLTAIGPPEDLTFAALYPSCRGVFGLHDDLSDDNIEIVDSNVTGIGLTYDVIGLYSDRDLIAELGPKAIAIAKEELAFIAKRLGIDAPEKVPERLTCVGGCSVESTGVVRPDAETVHLAMGHRPADALIALISDEIDLDAEVDPGTTQRCLSSLRELAVTLRATELILDRDWIMHSIDQASIQ